MEHLESFEGVSADTGSNTRQGQKQLEQTIDDESSTTFNKQDNQEPGQNETTNLAGKSDMTVIKIEEDADEEVSASYSCIDEDFSSDNEEDLDSGNCNYVRGDVLENICDDEGEHDSDEHEVAKPLQTGDSQGIVATAGSRPSLPSSGENDWPDSKLPPSEKQQSFQAKEAIQLISNPTGSPASEAEFTRQKSKSDVISEFTEGANSNPASDSNTPTAVSLSLASSMKSSARHTIFSPLHIPRNNDHCSIPIAKILRQRNASQRELRPVHIDITQSLAMSMTRQHAQFAHACLDLLEKQDRNEAIRRSNIHRELLNCGKFKGMLLNHNAFEIGESNGDDESCQLLNLMKSGPLFKLHRRGGSATKKKKNNNGMKMTGSANYSGNGYDSVLSETSTYSSVTVISAGVVRTGITSKLLTKWKTKYVEVRKGVLSYYDDSPPPGLVRKNIPLLASTCTCVAINEKSYDLSTSIMEQFSGDKICSKLYAFELNVQGDVPRIFATGSKSTRQAWIKAICRGMIKDYRGDDAVNAAVLQSIRIAEDDDNSNLIDPEHHSRMRKYSDLSRAAKFASSPEMYIEFANQLWGSTHCIPVKSLQKLYAHMLDFSGIDGENRTTLQKQPRASNEIFWHDISRSIVVLNGHTIRGDSIYGAERVFGALTRSILECDKSTNALLERGAMRRRTSGDSGKRIRDSNEFHSKDAITEIQAVRFTRDILRNIGRLSEITDQLLLAVESLCENGRDFVVIECVDGEVERAPTIKINSSSYLSGSEDHSLAHHRNGVLTDRREWIHVRDSKNPNSIQSLFCILSVGVLCFYKKNLPKPCLLQGQMFLVGARLGVWEQPEQDSDNDQKYILCVVGHENETWSERQLFFDDRECFLQWKIALDLAIRSCTTSSTQILEQTDQFALDEINTGQLPTGSPPSSPRKANIPSPTPLHLLEEDNDGITWIVQHPPGINETRIERRASRDFKTRTSLRERIHLAKSTGNIDPYATSTKKSTMPATFAERAKKSLLRTSRSSVDSFCQGTDESTINDVNIVQSRDLSVEIEFQTSQFYKVYFKKSLENAIGQSMPNKTIM